MALMFVLMMMALLMVLVLAIVQFSRSETKSASVVTQITEVRTLADLPTNLVMGQIRDATSGLGKTKTWASQPGMIRVFGTEKDGTTGRAKLTGAWKLYSSGQMVAGADFDAAAESAAMTGWHTRPATFSDLNAPVVKPLPGGAFRKVYPIFDPAAVGLIDGVSLDATTVSPTPQQPAPMPVRWLYVLRDGRFTVPVKEENGVAQFDAAVVSRENPLVGRVAFWTDDESCKVNINTASEGTPWDVPRSTSWTDRNYAAYVPVQNEFQRFPGHPATTCLSTVLGAFDDRFKWKDPALDANGVIKNTAFVSYLDSIYSITPRTNHGTPDNNTQGGSSKVNTSLAATLSGMPVKQERLFVSVDELFYDPQRVRSASTASAAPLSADELQMARFYLTAHSRAPETNLWNRPRVSLWPAHDAATAPQTAKDKLLAFCAKIGGRQVAWKRASMWTSATSPGSSQDPAADFTLAPNQVLFRYLQRITGQAVPGFGDDTFVSKYGENNRNQILFQIFDMQRWGLNSWCANFDPGTSKIDNKQSYFYLPPRAYTGKNGSYIGEAAASPAVATALPDNAQLPSAAPGQTAALKAFGRFPTIVEAAVVFMATEVADKDGKPVTAASTGTPLDVENNLTKAKTPDGWADKTTKMRAYIILQPFSAAIGMPPYTANIRYKIKGLENWVIDGKPIFPAGIQNAVNRAWRPAGAASENAHATAYTGLHAQFLKAGSGDKVAGQSKEDDNYPFVSNEIDVSKLTTFDFPGAAASTIKIELYSGFGTINSTPLQTIEMEFPKTTLRVPKMGFNPTLMPNPKPSVPQTSFMAFNERIKAGNLRNQLIGYGDTVRSVVVDVAGPSKGDYRHIAALPFVPKTYFKPHPRYFSNPSSTKTNDHINPAASYWDEAQSLRYAANNFQGHYGRTHIRSGLGANGGQQHIWQASGYVFNASGNAVTKPYGLVKDVAYWQDCQPACPILLDGAMNADSRPGDWDNGIGRIEDGPYINKPDEGGQEVGGNGYYSRGGFTEEKGRNYAPNRQISSAIAFGSLPSGIHPTPASQTSSVPRPWQTLLFCPNPPSRVTASTNPPTELDHFGFKSPRDHLLLDLFWMPVVEPYAISEPASTAGKINMNYQMMPFTHITRATGLHAAMRSVRITALPAAMAWASNANPSGASTPQKQFCYKAFLDADNLKFDTNYHVNMTETLQGFQARFGSGDLFHSASEICDLFLVPEPIAGHSYISSNNRTGKTLSKPSQKPKIGDMISWWNGDPQQPDDGMKLTGDNTRESPYNQLYPRLTTRSNVFQVHYRVQALKKARSTPVTVWDEKKDRVGAEQRGSVVLERYIDPNDAALPDFVANPDADGALDDHYRFRIIRSKIFAP
jgi:uncharacterized protein (TIGR02600 family)